MALPDGVVTFLFTDVEGSTRLWEEAPEAMMAALLEHDAAIERAASEHGGTVVRPRGEGDSRFVVFPDASDAVGAAAEIQRLFAEMAWTTPRPLRVRIALHTGTADLRLGDYYGSAVNRTARLRAIAHGGQTIMSAATWELVREDPPPGVGVEDMGLHALKDLTRPERVYQLDVDGLRARFPPLTSLGAVPNNLPIQLTEFVGREAELTAAARILGEARLLTILAPGGAGKTRLAIQAGAELTSDFPDGVFFIDLAPIGSPDDIIQTVAESLGIALSSDADLLTQLLAYLGRKRRLLVFDNFEHVVAGAGIVPDILRGAPETKVIATSRSKLNVAGETLMRLSGLDTEWADPQTAEKTSGVRLFVEAAARADASFVLSDADIDPLGRILRLVDGMPLGIELAAAWADVLSLDEIASEIAKSLDFLESEKGGVADRHHSMRAVFDYSWSLLRAEERRTFEVLAVFRDGFTRQAAETVAGATVRDLAGLVSKSLLVSDRDSGRYAIHALLRQYAEDASKGDGTTWEDAETAHAAFFAGRAAHAEHLLGSSDQKQALQIVEDDLDNMRAGWRHALARGDAAQARRFVFALWFLHDIRGWHQAALSLFAEAQAAFAVDSPDPDVRIVRAASDGVQGWFTTLLGRHEEGARQAGEARATLATLPDLTAYVMATQFHSLGLMYLGRTDELHEVSSAAVRRAEEAGDDWLAAEVKTYLAGAEVFMDHGDIALRLIAEGERVLVERGEYRKLSMNLWAKALIANRERRFHDAIEILKEVVANATEIGFRRMRQLGLDGLGEAYLATGELAGADGAFLDSLAASEQMGSQVEMASLLTKVARVRARMGRLEEAASILAGVLSDPISRHMTIFENVPVGDAATELLDEIARRLDEPAHAAARVRGRSRTLDVITKELLTERTQD